MLTGPSELSTVLSPLQIQFLDSADNPKGRYTPWPHADEGTEDQVLTRGLTTELCSETPGSPAPAGYTARSEDVMLSLFQPSRGHLGVDHPGSRLINCRGMDRDKTHSRNPVFTFFTLSFIF